MIPAKYRGLVVSTGIGAAVGAMLALIAKKSGRTSPGGAFVPPYSGGGVVVPTGVGADFFNALSPRLPERSRQLYEAVKSSIYDEPSFSSVTLSYKGHTAIVRVTSDAFKIYGVRINVDQYHGQLITDIMGAIPMTSVVSDAAWAQATRRPSITVYAQIPGVVKDSAQSEMTTTKAMVGASAVVDEKLRVLGAAPGDLCGNVGKDWLINAWPWEAGPAQHCSWVNPGLASVAAATNYGMYIPSGVVQGAANCHDLYHTDYSQVLRFIDESMEVDGESMLASDVIMDPELAGLLTGGGALPGWRHPGVPVDTSGVA